MATLLPNGVQQFLDSNGNPLSNGTVGFYVPNTTSPKDTWMDSGATILNTNPIILDSAGEAIIYGSGIYRQIVKDALGNLIWDQLTADTAAGGLAWGGISGGTANAQTIAASSFSSQDGQQISFIAGLTNTSQMTVNGIAVLNDTIAGPAPLGGGEVVQGNAITLLYDAPRGAFHLINPVSGTLTGELKMITGSTIPPGYVWANGQSLSRTIYAPLWGYAQGSGNLAASQGAKTPGQYGPGDGTTTFTVPELTTDGGQFVRPLAASGRVIGSSQSDDNKSHVHTGTALQDGLHDHGYEGMGNTGNFTSTGVTFTVYQPTALQSGTNGLHTHNLSIDATGSESRPKNVAYPYIIKT